MARVSRPYVKIDQSLASHPKTLGINPKHYWAAIGFLVACIAWCDRLRSDGFIPEVALSTVGFAPYSNALSELLRVGFLDKVDGGYVVHDYLDWQDSAEEIAAKSRSGRKAARAKWEQERIAERNAERNAECNAEGDAERYAPSLTEPSLTEPSRAERARAFADAWGSYPLHRYREQAEMAFEELIRDEDLPKFVAACRNAPRDGRQSLGYFIRDGAWRDCIPRAKRPECKNPDCIGGHIETPKGMVRCPDCNGGAK